MVKNKKKTDSKKKKNKKGFTLVELLATIVIIALIGGVSTVVYLNSIKASKEKATVLAINNVQAAAELFSKENYDDVNWRTSYDDGGNPVGKYVCFSIQQLINKGYFNKDFFEKDIYKDRINANYFVEVSKNMNAGEYSTSINTESKSINECENSMMDVELDSRPYTDRLFFNVSERDNYTFKYGLSGDNIGDDQLTGSGSCDGNDCFLGELRDDAVYKIKLCKSDSCQYFDLTSAAFKDTKISFNPTQERYYYRDVTIEYDDEGIYENSGFYFKSDVVGSLKNTVDVYECSNYGSCGNTKITNIQKDKLYKLSNSKKVIFTISEDVNTNKKVYSYLRDSRNTSTKEALIPTIKTTYTVNYEFDGAVRYRIVCTYNQNCSLETPGFSFSNPGYDFVGWLNKADNSRVNSPIKITEMLSNDTFTLIPDWRLAVVTYNISYSLNNGSYGTYHPTSASVGSVVTISNPTRSGYTFTGWTASGLNTSTAKMGSSNNPTTSWSGTSTKNQYFKDLRSSSGTVTMTANWSANSVSYPNATCPSISSTSVTYDGRAHYINSSGGSGGTVQYSTNNSTWSTSSVSRTDVGTTTVYVRVLGDSSHNTVTCGSANITINAAPTVTTYNISYSLNGGSYGASHPTSATTSEVVSISNPTKTGYIFEGWSANNVSSSAKMGNTSNPTTGWSGTTTTTNQFFKYLGNANATVTMIANWYEICSSTTNVTGVKTYWWKYVKSECDEIGVNSKGQSKLRRYYDFKEYECTCKNDIQTGKTCSATAGSDLAGTTHKSDNENWNHRAVIQYLADSNGQKSCKNNLSNGDVNSYVKAVCTDGQVNTKTGKEKLFFHGYEFYDYNDGAEHTSFSPSSKWTHNVYSKMDDRIDSSKSATEACLHACKLKYGSAT